MYKKVKDLKKEQKSSYNNGIADSIRYCLENRSRENEKNLKLLLKSFEDHRNQTNSGTQQSETDDITLMNMTLQ